MNGAAWTATGGGGVDPGYGAFSARLIRRRAGLQRCPGADMMCVTVGSRDSVERIRWSDCDRAGCGRSDNQANLRDWHVVEISGYGTINLCPDHGRQLIDWLTGRLELR